MFYSIKDFAELIGVSQNTLRLWDKQGKLKPHHRTHGNKRVYTSEQAQEYLGSSTKKEVIFTFIGGSLKNYSISSLSLSEIEQLEDLIKKVKEGIINENTGFLV